MAFIEFADAAPPALPIAHSALFAIQRTAADRPSRSEKDALATSDPLGALERRVVMLARNDGSATLRPARKRSWLARLILGPPPPSPVLANDRLEALRRLAVNAWQHGYTLPASALGEAREAGFDETQISAVLDTVARQRPAFRRLAA